VQGAQQDRLPVNRREPAPQKISIGKKIKLNLALKPKMTFMKKLLVAAIALSGLFITGCNSTDKNDPKAVLMSFFDALQKKDIAAARKLATAESKTMLDMMEMGMKMGDKKEDDGKYKKEDMEFGDPKIEGDKATIAVKEKKSGESTNFTLKKEDGGWKVAFDKSSMMNMGMEKMQEKGMDVDSTIDKGLDKLKEMNVDSLSDKLKESMKKLEDAGKNLQNH
jgi:outer membrane murein-binding lipoprotein Lpp